ncbi:MAG: hypothetical protein IPL61_13160 [Myxococcales bacterium]|nr:hypothetical protein [Myxococcales bacterium]
MEQDDIPDISRHLIRVSEDVELYCLPAGMPSANYARQLSLIDPEAWYREDNNPLRTLIDLLGTSLPFLPDTVLLDSRTGITRLSGPLLFDLADIACIAFFPHPQSEKGTAALVSALLSSRTRRSTPARSFAPEPRFIVSPIPASKTPEVVQRYQHRAAEWIHRWLGAASARPSHWDESELVHFVPYQESLAASDTVFDDRDTWKPYEPIADWIQRFIPSPDEAESTDSSIPALKAAILSELHFPGGTAEERNKSNLVDTFVETDLVTKALLPTTPTRHRAQRHRQDRDLPHAP